MGKTVGELLRRFNDEHAKAVRVNRLKVSKLKELADNGHIQDDYAVKFLNDMQDRLNRDLQLSPNQQDYLDKCFERY